MSVSSNGSAESTPTPKHYPLSYRRSLSRHLSTPHLETFRVTRSASSVTPVNNYMASPPTLVSTFSTFTNKKNAKSPQALFQDDPNPYSVSRIQEFRIQIQDPFKMKTKSNIQLNRDSSSAHYYQDLDDYDADDHVTDTDADHSSVLDVRIPYKKNTGSIRNSGGYEVPDVEVSSGGSSEDLPLPPSDSSDGYSNSLSISASSDGMSPVPSHFNDAETLSSPPTKISERDRARIELALCGRKTEVYVSDSLANLYYRSKVPPRPSSSGSTTTSASTSTSSSSDQSADWLLKYTGVPVLLLDTGETKSRDKRRIQIVLSELGSGLALWKDTIDNLSSYCVVGGDGTSAASHLSTFHTMHLSADHTKVIGLSFDNEESADKFGKQVDKLTSDFANISLSGYKLKKMKNNGKNKKEKKKGEQWKRPSKNDISQPCYFQHVSSLSPKDKNLFSSLQHFVSGKSGSSNPSSQGSLPVAELELSEDSSKLKLYSKEQ